MELRTPEGAIHKLKITGPTTALVWIQGVVELGLAAKNLGLTQERLQEIGRRASMGLPRLIGH